MNMRFQRVLLIGVMLMLLSGCAGPSASAKKVDIERAFEPLIEKLTMINALMNIDLYGCVQSFQRKNGRWPNEADELRSFVEQSNGYLFLGEYDRMTCRPLTNNGIAFRYVMKGRTNESDFVMFGSEGKVARFDVPLSMATRWPTVQLRELFYCALSFRGRNERWPNDANELQAYVNQSDRYLDMDKLRQLSCAPLANDGVELRFVPSGRTNEMRWVLGGDPEPLLGKGERR